MIVLTIMCPTKVVAVPCSWSNVLWLIVDGDGQSYVNVKTNDVVVNWVERSLLNLWFFKSVSSIKHKLLVAFNGTFATVLRGDAAVVVG